jgi:hypothetical protein
LLSVLFTVSYLGLGTPAVAAGFAVAKGSGLVATSYEYGLAVIALAVFAAGNLIRLRRRDRLSTADNRAPISLPTRHPDPSTRSVTAPHEPAYDATPSPRP